MRVVQNVPVLLQKSPPTKMSDLSVTAHVMVADLGFNDDLFPFFCMSDLKQLGRMRNLRLIWVQLERFKAVRTMYPSLH